ncbi:hypothetical protein PR048_021050 [Dryococelus australis]|uniref:Uncharacterized protein n=1 Tax=Dryococelus australis TaxID=614101 RepID=A0ABQ9GX50_9NEOP|nr:hypothetical protein PR048_021050 [Dryococelus australis]
MNNGNDSYSRLETATSLKSYSQSFLLADQAINDLSEERYEEDLLLNEALGDEDTSLSKVEHSKWLGKFDDAFYKVMCVTKSLKQLSVQFHQNSEQTPSRMLESPFQSKSSPHFLEKSKVVTSDNFDIAWKLLIKQNNNKWVIVANHIDTLLLASVATSYSAQPLCGWLSAFIDNVAALKALNMLVDQCDMLLLHLLGKHMDQALGKQWELVIQELDIPKLSDFTDLLQNTARRANIASLNQLTIAKCLSSIVLHQDLMGDAASYYDEHYKIDKIWSMGNSSLVERDLTKRICAKPSSGRFLNGKGQMIMFKLLSNCLSCLSTKSCRFYSVLYNTMLLFPLDKPTTIVTQSAQDDVPVDTSSNEDIFLSVLSSFSNDS